jgi:glycerol-3-phosphate dehydrogenase
MNIRGKILYDGATNIYDQSLTFQDETQLGSEPYDMVIIGAGVVGCALAYKLSRFQSKVLLIDKNYDVGEGTSKGNSAIVHTGFDAAVGTLESKLVTRASRQWPELAAKLKIPYDPCGALLIALNEEQHVQLDKIYKKALDNGVDDVQLLTAAQARELEPGIASDVRGGMLVPREALADPFMLSIACAEVALTNGVDILLGAPVVAVENADSPVKNIITASGHAISTRLIINVAGLGSRLLADQYNGAAFDINPRRGQFLIFDKYSRSLTKRILLPIPTAQTKGVLVIPTIFGNLLAGPTAEDFPLENTSFLDTTKDGLQGISAQVSAMLPALKTQPVIGTYSGARCNCAQGSYLIRYHDGHNNILTVTGIRSTGFTSSPALADHLIAGMKDHHMFTPVEDPQAVDYRSESCWPGWWRKPQEKNMLIEKRSDYGHTVCFCEQISEAEITEALDSPLKPRTLDAVKRRTRTQMGRCQGFDCQIRIAEMISNHCGLPPQAITKNGPGSEIITPILEK